MATLVAACGEPVCLSAAASSLSDQLYDSPGAVMALGVNLAAVRLLAEAAELLASRCCPGSAPPTDSVPELLAKQPFAAQVAVLRAASDAGFFAVARLAKHALSALLRGRSPDVLRVVLDATDDLSADEKRAALSEQLLTPPSFESGELSAREREEEEEEEEAALCSCLEELDARSLRSVKAVSRVWRRRARAQLGDPRSAWRAAPEWSAGEWARSWFAPRLASGDATERKKALLTMDALEAAVELPEYAAACVASLSDERSSARALALRAIARLEPLTLGLHAAAVAEAFARLEEHELGSAAAERIRRCLEHGEAPSPPADAPILGPDAQVPRATSSSGEQADGMDSGKRKRPPAAPLVAHDLRHQLSKSGE